MKMDRGNDSVKGFKEDNFHHQPVMPFPIDARPVFDEVVLHHHLRVHIVAQEKLHLKFIATGMAIAHRLDVHVLDPLNMLTKGVEEAVQWREDIVGEVIVDRHVTDIRLVESAEAEIVTKDVRRNHKKVLAIDVVPFQNVQDPNQLTNIATSR